MDIDTFILRATASDKDQIQEIIYNIVDGNIVSEVKSLQSCDFVEFRTIYPVLTSSVLMYTLFSIPLIKSERLP